MRYSDNEEVNQRYSVKDMARVLIFCLKWSSYPMKAKHRYAIMLTRKFALNITYNVWYSLLQCVIAFWVNSIKCRTPDRLNPAKRRNVRRVFSRFALVLLR